MLGQAVGSISLACLAVAVATLVALHLVDSGLSPIRNAVSQYGISRYRFGYRVMTVALGLSGLALAVGVGGRVSARGTNAAVALLVVFAVARLVISWFPMDAPGAPLTSFGRAHGLIAIATFVSVTVAALRLGGTLHRSTDLHGLSSTSTGLGAAMTACVLALLLTRASPSARRFFGLVERALYVAILGWMGTFGAALAIGAH